jgi:hypothetical protein
MVEDGMVFRQHFAGQCVSDSKALLWDVRQISLLELKVLTL